MFLQKVIQKVSIHAPAGGATPNYEKRGLAGISFNPRSRGGSDCAWFLQLAGCAVSIHAPAGGATHTICGAHTLHVGFNPRSRGGSDSVGCCDFPVTIVFQSTLPRGERQAIADPAKDAFWFQSTLPRGERRLKELPARPNRKFQSTLPRGERQEC